MEDLTGRQLGPYQIVAPLGEGGMAAVYKAYQPAVERHVALKVLPRNFASDPQFTARFQREARMVAQLQHPHILPVFDFGQAEGYTYIAMPFVQSGTLTALLTGQPLPLPRIQQIISQVGAALNYAHGRGLIHRDVKPSNILLDENGNCLLTDFGLARMVEASVNLTSSGAIVGTPAYMSPEQGSGLKLDARSDIYSLGVILYEMATGRVPYKAETPIAVIFKHIQDPLPPARSLNPGLPEPIELVIQKALAKTPEDRYQTAGDLVRALEAARPARQDTLDVQEIPLPPPHLTDPVPVSPKQKPTRNLAWGMIGFLLLCLVAGGSLSLALLMARNYANPRSPTITATSRLVATPSSPPAVTPTSPPTASPTAELVPDWEAIGGNWTGPDENGLIYGKTASFDGDALYLFKNIYTDFTFSVAVQALTREASLAIRMSDDGKNGYLVIFIPRGSQGGNPGLWLAKRVNGDHSFPAAFAADYGLGEWVRLTVEANGAHIRVLLNGEQVIDFEDPQEPFTSGRLGVRCYGEPATPCEAKFSEFYMSH
jgi:serine/threonine protein kinase